MSTRSAEHRLVHPRTRRRVDRMRRFDAILARTVAISAIALLAVIVAVALAAS